MTQLRHAVDALLTVPVEGLDAAEFVPLLAAVEVQRRRLEAVDQRLLAGATVAGVASLFGPPGLAGVLASVLRVDGPEARRRVARAGDLGPRRSLTGEVLEPILPTAGTPCARTPCARTPGATSPARVRRARGTSGPVRRRAGRCTLGNAKIVLGSEEQHSSADPDGGSNTAT